MATRKTAAPAKKTAPAKRGASGVKARADKEHNPWAGVSLPAGFTAITNGDYGQDWDFENGPILVGTIVGEVRTIEVKRGKRLESQRVVTIDGNVTTADGEVVGTGPHTVWDSAALHTWFDTIQPGMGAAVCFQGYRDVGKGAPMKMFLGALDGVSMPTVDDAPPAGRRGAGKPTAKTRRAKA